MNADASQTPSPAPSSGHHLATISHLGRFWDVYVEFTDDPRQPQISRALLAYSPADPGDHEGTVRTTTIIIEQSFEDAMRKARSFEEHHLVGLLRSTLPDPDEKPETETQTD